MNAKPSALPNIKTKEKLFNRGILTVLNAQFFSAFADNALFFALMEIISQGSFGKEGTYILQGTFALFYILLAPFVGHVADNLSKGQVLLIGNGIKIIGISLLFAGINPFVCYAIVGLGAAVYSPAKFGILSELVSNNLLIKANGLIEGSTIVAILLGSALGGILAESNVTYAILLAFSAFFLALIFNLFIPKLSPKRKDGFKLGMISKKFIIVLRRLLMDKKARFAILGTSLFWCGVAVLKLLLNDWVRDVLGEGTEKVSELSLIVGVGVILGSAIAAITITQKNIKLSLWAGIGMSISVILFLTQENLYLAYTALLCVGVCGGIFLIPLNALLQERGGKLKSTGTAIAIQNLFENSFMMIALLIFGGLSALTTIHIGYLMAIFAGLFSLLVLALFIHIRIRNVFA
ncbi:lysophospholipid transporter LplT [Ignatzschineria rhizosphaerae]|uniref:Lysophospholipid transporter LplT n=1 Tax=Ignatzschineria rhizosphaerae TaxID=2923279 RepID=A0ABY3X0X5_9GAMM|nr:lysophospholipid transporter LplT [Ignatzschineria rhizosphaerae]UNM95421.1 lysophospholipid transporter LplT [Ignatzschineria rhizosphaerae]